MPRKNRAVLLLLASSLAFMMAGCGSGPSTTGPAPGGFTTASLNGTYAFALSGTNAGGFFAVAGSFTANGAGTITGGMEDFNSPGTATVLTNTPITGSYAVRSDGRTSVTLVASNVTLNLDLVLLNTSSGLTIRFQPTASASGSVDLQNSSAFSLTTLAGPFATSLAGVNAAGGSEASAGLLNFDTSGDIIGGSVLDDNSFGAITTNAAIPTTALALSSPVSGRGTLTFPSPVTGATLHFAYYVVDANHLKVVQIDSGITASALSGDAFRQTSTTVSGSFAFTLGGATTALNPFIAGGILNTDGAGNVLNTSVSDVDNGVTAFLASTTTGTYSLSGGRGTMQVTGSFGTLNFAFYPSTGGLQLVELDTSIVSSGAALQQTGGPFSNSSLNGGYGLNLTGVDLVAGTEIDGIAQFNTTGTGTWSGALDFNDGGVLSNSFALNGTYSISANGRGTGILHSSLGTFNIIMYMASNSRVLFIESDNNQMSVGVIALQQ